MISAPLAWCRINPKDKGLPSGLVSGRDEAPPSHSPGTVSASTASAQPPLKPPLSQKHAAEPVVCAGIEK